MSTAPTRSIRTGYMVKGGGAALTREKIVAAQSERFVCIADQSSGWTTLGRFPVPVEVIPMAARRVDAAVPQMGGQASVRCATGRRW
jgi:ribose 5-phosphate isomerase A